MKKLLAILSMSLFIFAMVSGIVYLKEEEPEVYRQIVERLDKDTQIADNNEIIKESDATSGDNEDESIDVSTKESIPSDELQSVQKTGRVPLEGNGEEIDNFTSPITQSETGEYSFLELLYPYRAMLNEEEQKVYDQIYENALNYNNESFSIQATINKEEIDNIMLAVFNDHPELFWLETQYNYQYGKDGEIYSIRLIFNEIIDNIESNKEIFDNKVTEIINLANQYETDVEKEQFVHDYLIDTVVYDEGAALNQSAFSALVNGQSVCAGYSRAFQHIMMQMGIPVYYCTGVADGGAHAWNIIKLGDNFYNVDLLWDDTVGESYDTKCYVYFNLPDSEFSKDHTRTGLSINLPNCTQTNMTYESLYGGSAWGDMLSTYGLTQDDVISTLEEYYEVCIEKLTEAGTGQSTFTIALKDKELFDEIYNDAKQEENLNGYMNTVAQNLGLTNYRLLLEFSVTQLPDESIILTQNSNIISK